MLLSEQNNFRQWNITKKSPVSKKGKAIQKWWYNYSAKQGFMTKSIESPAKQFKKFSNKIEAVFFWKKKTQYLVRLSRVTIEIFGGYLFVFFIFKLNFDLNRGRLWRQNKGHDLYHAYTMFTSVCSLFLV